MTDPTVTIHPETETVVKYRPVCSDPECPKLALADTLKEAERNAEHHRRAYHGEGR